MAWQNIFTATNNRNPNRIYTITIMQDLATVPTLRTIDLSDELILEINGGEDDIPIAGSVSGSIRLTIFDKNDLVWDAFRSESDPSKFRVRISGAGGYNWYGFIRLSTDTRPRYRTVKAPQLEVEAVCGLGMLENMDSIAPPYSVMEFFETALKTKLHPETSILYVSDLQAKNDATATPNLHNIVLNDFDAFTDGSRRTSLKEQLEAICARFNLRVWQSPFNAVWHVYQIGKEGDAHVAGIGQQAFSNVAVPIKNVIGSFTDDTTESITQGFRRLTIKSDLPSTHGIGIISILDENP